LAGAVPALKATQVFAARQNAPRIESGPFKATRDETARTLSIGISNLIVGLSPEMIVIGGPITRA
jgi:hypothetical protein